MFWWTLWWGLVAALSLAVTAPVRADDRMRLGAVSGSGFQSEVGDRVFFGDASAELGSRGRIALDAQAAWLLRNSAVSVIIEGHADDTGGADHNLDVSRKRAEAVRRRLIHMGIAQERIRIVAYGRERLVAQCAAAACAAQNRRAVTIVGPPLDTVLRDQSRRTPRHFN
jgi:outer membrane protein OmpA-like peptidoglycan-associated protein